MTMKSILQGIFCKNKKNDVDRYINPDVKRTLTTENFEDIQNGVYEVPDKNMRLEKDSDAVSDTVSDILSFMEGNNKGDRNDMLTGELPAEHIESGLKAVVANRHLRSVSSSVSFQAMTQAIKVQHGKLTEVLDRLNQMKNSLQKRKQNVHQMRSFLKNIKKESDIRTTPELTGTIQSLVGIHNQEIINLQADMQVFNQESAGFKEEKQKFGIIVQGMRTIEKRISQETQ